VNDNPTSDFAGNGTIQKLTRLLAAPIVEPSQRAARIQTVEKDIVLPLRVLTITILGYYFFFSGWFDTPGSTNIFTASSKIKDFPGFIRRLSRQSDPVSAFLWQSLPAPDQSQLMAYEPSAPDAKRTRKIVVQALNKIIGGPCIYDLERFKGVPLRAETIDLLKGNRKGPNLALLNRYLLEDEYPLELARDTPGATKLSDWNLLHAPVLKTAFVAYVFLNAIVGAVLIWARNLSLVKIQWMIFGAGVLDAVTMGTLTFMTTGFDSKLYLLFPVLILHNALSIPVAFPQLLLNFLVSVAFMVGGIEDRRFFMTPDDPRDENPIERMIVLAAWALCCYGIQMLFEKQKRAEAEATEFAVRQERLRTAGRLAAEIAHQIKNPLGIIINSAFSLQRAAHEGVTAVDEQIQIIREEVERADQIITELMGYAQLAEGKVERLEVTEELDNALNEVFPPAAKYEVKIYRDYAPSLPALLMQKRHLSSVLVNLMQNAREAMHGRGKIRIAAEYGNHDSIRILIEDDGPGIPPDKIDKIFEAYFTTRAKGTGLGLAIVKHNTEMYGGAVTVHSELGKGTGFAVEFPARILMRLSK
jgi:signal transduction histidine kinase